MKKLAIGEYARRNWALGVMSMALALSVALAVMYFAAMDEASAAKVRLESVYEKAFFETCELTEGMAVNYSKLLATGSDAQAMILLNDISLQAQGTLSNLSMLPLEGEQVAATIKFVNQAGDFAQSLSAKLAMGESMQADDKENLTAIAQSARSFSGGMQGLLDRHLAGENVFDWSAEPEGDAGAQTNPAGEYPVLIYDGPFSDAAQTDRFMALEGAMVISQDEAAGRLSQLLGVDVSNVTPEGESDIPVRCYDFSAEKNGIVFSAGITQNGGKILYLMSGAGGKQAILSEQECVDAAARFLQEDGYENMRLSYYAAFDGMMTINFTAVQDGVVLYPDLVKVQVSMEDGQIVGMEANNYLRNHVHRNLPQVELSAQEAQEMIGESLTAYGAQLCLIPVNNGEYLCYEVQAEGENGEYLVYIDAVNGAEREILQVLSAGSGELVM